jgi:hypothetical protein
MPLSHALSSLPPPEAIRKTAEEVIARPHFHLGDAARPDAPPLLLQLFEWILRPFVWLFGALAGLPEPVRWLVVIVSVLLCAALVTHIVYTLVRAIRGPAARRGRYHAEAGPELNPADLERDAERAGARGDYLGAIRLLFRAALRRIELSEDRKFRPGFSNRQMLRRYRATPLVGPLELLVATIELKWYGDAPCGQADYLTCRDEHARIRQYVQASGTAHTA